MIESSFEVGVQNVFDFSAQSFRYKMLEIKEDIFCFLLWRNEIFLLLESTSWVVLLLFSLCTLWKWYRSIYRGCVMFSNWFEYRIYNCVFPGLWIKMRFKSLIVDRHTNKYLFDRVERFFNMTYEMRSYPRVVTFAEGVFQFNSENHVFNNFSHLLRFDGWYMRLKKFL